VLDRLIAAVPTPAPTPTSNVDADAVTPGVWGFVVTAAIGVLVILLIVDMIRRLRRLNYRAQIRARLEAEQAAGAGPARDSGTTGDDDSATPRGAA
jgi:hypothetical protein